MTSVISGSTYDKEIPKHAKRQKVLINPVVIEIVQSVEPKYLSKPWPWSFNRGTESWQLPLINSAC